MQEPESQTGQILTLEGVEIRSGARQHAPLKGRRQRSEGSGQAECQAALPAIAPPQFRSGPVGSSSWARRVSTEAPSSTKVRASPSCISPRLERRWSTARPKPPPQKRKEKRPPWAPDRALPREGPKVVPAVDGLIEHAAPRDPKGTVRDAAQPRARPRSSVGCLRDSLHPGAPKHRPAGWW